MKTVIRLRVLASLLIVAFTISSVLSCPGKAVELIVSALVTSVSCDSDSSHKSDTGLFDEEKTEEERSEDAGDDKSDRLQNNLYFICTVTEPVRLAFSESQHHFFFNAPRTCGNFADVPRYVSQRSFLI